jgi:phage-related protein
MHSKKDVDWRGDSRKEVRSWPVRTRDALGAELMRVQLGADPRDGATLPEVGAGVKEIRVRSRGEAYRVVYVASFGAMVYVLHAFHKKSKRGIATPKTELDLARQRYKEVCAEVAGRAAGSRRQQ